MGGRGASSGTSARGNPYGSQYHCVYQSGNIKFVTKNGRDSETLMETMTSGRVYVHVEGDDIKSIVYFDGENRRYKQIDLDHAHKGGSPHVHRGYLHDEYDSLGNRLTLSDKEQKMVERVVSTWQNRRRGK